MVLSILIVEDTIWRQKLLFSNIAQRLKNRQACSSQIQYLSNSTKITTNTETAMLSMHTTGFSSSTLCQPAQDTGRYWWTIHFHQMSSTRCCLRYDHYMWKIFSLLCLSCILSSGLAMVPQSCRLWSSFSLRWHLPCCCCPGWSALLVILHIA